MSRRRGALSAATTPAAPEPAADPTPIPSTNYIQHPGPLRGVRSRGKPATPIRRISAKVVKAETQLLAFARRRAASLEHHERTWADKRDLLIASFPGDVRVALSAMGILDPIDEPMHQTNGAAAPAPDASEVGAPLPAASATAAAPADPSVNEVAQAGIDLVELHETLAEVANEWSARGSGVLIRGWTEAQRREALEWATAVLHDGPMVTQAKRPAHTFIAGRQPGEAH